MKEMCGIRRKRSEMFCRTSKKMKEKKSMARMRRSSEQTLEYRIEQAEGEDLTSYLECAPAFGGFIFGSSQCILG